MKRDVVLQVRGMHCGNCVQAVQSALAAVPGVQVAEVRIGSATVTLDDAISQTGALIDAVDDAGYEATEKPA